VSIRIRSLTRRLGGRTVLDALDLEIPAGRLVALLGPSGSGKTTLLRLIAGLDQPDEGTVEVGGAGSRPVGFVFQHYALFPHLTVRRNIAFGLEVQPRRVRPPKAAIRAKVDELLKLVQLEAFGSRLPSELSGGQRQRVALARCLAVEPEVLLLDEPFGALDAQVRAELRRWLRGLHDRTGLTTVFVTHDQEEAMEVADHIVVLNGGRVEQQGPPEEVYANPASPFVYRFIGQSVRFHGHVDGGVFRHGDRALPSGGTAGRVEGYLRPHELEVRREPCEGSLPAVVLRLQATGPVARIQLRILAGGDEVEAQLELAAFRRLALAVGEEVQVLPGPLALFPLADYQI
jgi:sulfate/thiosulfate transport system ATP-binding protein